MQEKKRDPLKRTMLDQLPTLDEVSLTQVIGGSGKRTYKPIRFGIATSPGDPPSGGGGTSDGGD